MTTQSYVYKEILIKGLKSEGQAYEDLLNSILILIDPNFRKVSPYGNIGDRKNDGFSPDKGCFYQVFDPKNINNKKTINDAIDKLEKDFEGLFNNWNDITPIKEFRFAINDKQNGCPPQVEQTIGKLRIKFPYIIFRTYTLDNLIHDFQNLPISNQEIVIGNIPDIRDVYFKNKKFKKDLNIEDIGKWSNDVDLKNINYVDRKIKFIETENSFQTDIFNTDEQNKINLNDELNSRSKILLLGNPGIGKSTELKSIFYKFFNDKEQPYIPYFKNLKTFTTLNTIESFIGLDEIKEWEPVLLIFDGIDEIKDISDFTSKLNQFISILDRLEDFKYSLIISCRNNIFERISNQIDGFKIAKIEPLNFYQSVELFEKIIERKITDSEREKVESKSEFLQNPFQVKLIAEKFQKDGEINVELASLWEYYINERLQNDKKEKFNKGGVTIDVIQFKKDAEKLSLVNELEQKSYFDKTTLNKLFDPNSDDFADNFCQNGLIDQVYLEEQYFLEHKSIQEYFAAINFIKKPTSNIIDFLKISLIDKIHPSLYNVASFILRLLPDNSDNKNELIDWLEKTQPDLLIKTFDSEQTIDFKIQVFQNYFQKQCIEKGYWFNTNNSISDEEFARFGDCKENAEFLFEIIKNNDTHFRTRISAIQILGEFTLDQDYFETIKSHFFDGLKNYQDNDEELNSRIIYFFRSQIQKNATLETEILNELFKLFKSSDNKEINRSLLGLLIEVKDLESYFNFIKREFEYEFNIKTRTSLDEVHRGNDWILKEFLLKFENANNFIELASYHCDDHNLRYDDDYSSKLIERFKYFSKLEEVFIISFFKKIQEREIKNKPFSEEILTKIILDCGKQNEAFDFYFKVDSFHEDMWFLGALCTEDTITTVLKNYNELNTKSRDLILTFRNILSYSYNDLARKFEKETQNKGYDYKEDLLLPLEEIQQRADELNQLPQQNFDMLFQKEISKTLEKPEIILEFLKRQLENDKSKQITVKKPQNEKIKSYCDSIIETINFDNVVTVNSETSFTLSKNYNSIHLITYFYLNHEIIIEKDNLINSIKYFEIEKTDDSGVSFNHFIERINDKSDTNRQIIENLKNVKNDLTNFMFKKHINYALENELKDSYTSIKVFFSKNKCLYSGDKLYYKYLDLTKDADLISENLSIEKPYTYWSTVKYLIENVENIEEYKSRLIEGAKNQFNESETEFLNDALKVLFFFKDENAIEYYMQILDRKLTRSIAISFYSEYDLLKDNDFSIIKKLYLKLKEIKRDSFEYSYANTFVTTYISNICENEDSFNQIMEILNSIKLEYEKDKIENDTDLFYINLLIDAITNNFINKLSKPLSFDEALIKANEIMKP